MLIRFTLPFRHHDTNRPIGVFRGSYWVNLEARLHEGEKVWLLDEIDWFNRNLPAPWSVDPRAVFWFRPSAGAPLSRIWTMVRLLEDNGVPVHVYRTRRPGIVVYQDQYQVAAVPWRDTFATRMHSHA